MSKGMKRQALLRSSALTGSQCAILCAILWAGPVFAQTQTYSFAIPAESLSTALRDFARISGQQIIFTDDLVSGKTAPALQGNFTSDNALSQLLTGTELTTERAPSGAIMVRSKNAQAASNEAARETVVVTGTHIEGVGPTGSQVNTYTREDLDRSGAATLEEFARKIPENLANTDGIANVFSSSQRASLPGGDANNNAGAAFNLSGLGVGATLTLINGHRVAASGDIGSFVDISMIPFSAIDHIEVLQDGSSSIYGSDAIAGVVNIIMRKDFDGAQSTVRYGGATDGGADEFTASQLIGRSWSSGNAWVNLEYDGQNGLDASQRSYILSQGGPDTLLPKSHRTSLFFEGNQEIFDGTSISGEALYSQRNVFLATSTVSQVQNSFITNPGAVTQTGGTLSVNQKLFGDWQASLTANYSSIEQSTQQVQDISGSGYSLNYDSDSKTSTDTYSLDALANGSIWSIAGGDIKGALGASYRRESFGADASLTTGGATTLYPTPTLSRHVESVFGELYVPLVGAANAIPLVRRLEISGAVRYDKYSDFGASTNPKVGLIWSPIDDLKLRGTWGTSFRAPVLLDVGTPITYTAEFLPNAASPTHVTSTLLVGGGNPDLRPETATVFSAGADWNPQWDPALHVSVTYSNVKYKNLIGLPPITSIGTVFTDPVLAPFINTHPSLPAVQAAFADPGFQGDSTLLGPSGVMAILQDHFANLSADSLSNLDLQASYSIPTEIGQFTFNGVLDRFLDDSLQAAPQSPEASILNTFGEPSRWKARGGVAWAYERFSASFTLNFVNSYLDNLTVPYSRISSWTTADLYLGYTFPASGPASNDGGLLQNLRLSVTAQNIADEKPPYVLVSASGLLPGQNPRPPFDTVNASPIGRLIAVQLTKDL